MAFSLLPKEDEYFVFFSQITEKIQEASNILVEMMQDKRENFASFIPSVSKMPNTPVMN